MSDSETPTVGSDQPPIRKSGLIRREGPPAGSGLCNVCGVLADDLIAEGEVAICRGCHAGLALPLEDDGMSDKEAVDLFMEAIESLNQDVRRYRVYARDLMLGDRIVAEWTYPKGIDAGDARLGGERTERDDTVDFVTINDDGDIIVGLVGVPETVTYSKHQMFSVNREV